MKIFITHTTAISTNELSFTFSCSKGPGGQHVNKVNTKATLLFDITNSPSLTQTQKEVLTNKLSSRVNKNGVLRVTADEYRSQKANKDAATERFVDLLRLALHKHKHRTKSKIPGTQKRKRLMNKKFRSRLKEQRKKVLKSSDY